MTASAIHEATPQLLRRFFNELIDRPPPELDAFLDAAATCFARHGFGHTSVPDVARQLGVSRATVYRKIGGIDDFARLVLARDAHRLVDQLATELEDVTGPEAVVTMTATVVRVAAGHPLSRKVLADEPELAGELLRHIPALISTVEQMLAPYLDEQMARGEIKRSDPSVLADLMVRLAAAAVLAPPSDLDAHLRAVLLPLVEP